MQLHGDETPDFCRRFAGRYIKAVRLRDAASLARLAAYACDFVLVDADTPGYGGSGQRADVALARRGGRAARRVILAGGLTPDNVAEAIAAVRPYGVDVAGGVERAPGVKDSDQGRRVRAGGEDEAHESRAKRGRRGRTQTQGTSDRSAAASSPRR